MKASIAVLLLAFLAGTAGSSEPVTGGPCEGCEYVFIGMPARISPSARIAPDGEKGEALVIEGTVLRPDGTPAAGIVVYAYQTNAGGIYPAGKTRHGGLRGWVRSDGKGQYRFETIRPGAYPGRDIPQHVHMHVIEPGKATYYIDDVIFDDDPLLTPRHRQQMRQGRGGFGESHPARDAQGIWHVRRDIRLGAKIPGHGR